MLAAVIFILIMSVLVLIHEFGHFYSAKKFGVKVEEFGYGLPPRIIGKKIGETIYSINLLPFGGFVKIQGEDSLEETGDPRDFMSKSPSKRAIILFAGIFMNFVLAIVLYYVFFFSNGFKSLTIPLFFEHDFRYGEIERVNTVAVSLLEESAISGTTLEVGEAIIEIDNVPVYSVSDIQRELESKAGSNVSLLVMDVRSSERPLRYIDVIPDANDDGSGVLGVLLSSAVTIDYSASKNKAGFMHAYNMLSYTGSTLNRLVGVSVEEKTIEPVSEGVSGPVGIFSLVGNVVNYGGRDAILGLIDLTALLSLSLGIINLMPFPALDGGRLVFVFIEMIFRKRVNSQIETSLHKWGMILLLALIVLVTFKDIRMLIGG